MNVRMSQAPLEGPLVPAGGRARARWWARSYPLVGALVPAGGRARTR